MAEALTPEQQNEALTKQVTDLKTKSGQLEATIADQKGQLKTQGADLAKAVKDRDQAVADRDKAKTDLSEKVTRVRELELDAEANENVIAGHESRERAAKVAAQGGTTVVTHESQVYRVLVPQFHFEGNLVKGADLASNPALVAKLVDSRSGVLELVDEKD
ncbi:hypothetical protein QMK33_19285 [Hymenobacter sp. H14-R3]|uniref:hypothetical protein n=1 Tax=Hymenobacter sp. H14-R3 TaxID=3046308 RepID=UPI0024BB06AD|nr:hypothetical protein [Hymenobacter sp. H14-R3]MDJ0367297.1 hypothetical protein [Hymenobacter sp. H14-R3]